MKSLANCAGRTRSVLSLDPCSRPRSPHCRPTLCPQDGSSGGQIYHEYTRAALLERLNARALQLQVPPTQAAVAAAGAAAAGAAVPVTAPGSALHSLLQPAVHHPSVTPSAAAMLSGAAPPGTPLPHGLPLAAALQAQGLLGSRQFGMGGGAGHRFSAFGGGGGGGGGYPGGGGGGGGGGHHGHFPGGPGGPGGRAAAAVQHGHVTYRDLHVIGEQSPAPGWQGDTSVYVRLITACCNRMCRPLDSSACLWHSLMQTPRWTHPPSRRC